MVADRIALTWQRTLEEGTDERIDRVHPYSIFMGRPKLQAFDKPSLQESAITYPASCSRSLHVHVLCHMRPSICHTPEIEYGFSGSFVTIFPVRSFDCQLGYSL